MSSGMTGQTPCLTSRWDKPAQSKQRVDVRQQGTVGNAAHPVSSVGASTPAVSTPTHSTSQLPALSSAPQSSMAEGDKSAPQGGVEMAAAMAAKINAMLMAKGKLLTPPPLLAKTPPCMPMSSSAEETVITEVDINDVPINCRNLLTKGKTQEEIRQCSGAVVSTKGHYVCEAEKGRAVERPLYLHVQGKSQDQVNKAVRRIKEIISEDVMKTAALSGGQQVPIIPPLTLYPKPPRPAAPPSSMPWMHHSSSGHGHRPSAPHSGSFVHTKLFVGMEQALPSFNVNEKVGGPMGTYLGHIQTETGARVFLRGKSSGYIEQASRRESFEPLYVYISHPNAAGLEAAKKLTESLLETVKEEHARMLTTYTATNSNQPYAAHGFPPNSNYSNQGSWYNYPANGYAGGYSAYPGSGGYWSSANGPPSHSNLSTTPQSSQAMVQYPVCPRKPHPYLVQDPGSSDTVDPEGSPTREDAGSPKRRFQEDAVDDGAASSSSETPAKEASPPPAPSAAEEKGAERFLMPPPPPGARKRPRETAVPVPQRPAALPAHHHPPVPAGLQEDTCDKKCKVAEDSSDLVPYGVAEDSSGLVPYGVAKDSSGLVPYGVAKDSSGLVPYGGDSSDEEEERTHCSKTAHS